MKRLLKWLGIALSVPLLLILVAGMLLYVPPLQDFAVRKVAAYVSEQTGTDVTVGRLRLSFPLDLDVQQLTMLDAGGDTLVAADHALVDLDLSSIMRGRVRLDAVTLQRAQVDTREWIASTLIRGRLDELTLHDDVDLKAQHVALSSVEARGLDLDIALRDTTTEEDTTESAPLAWIIDVEHAAVEDARVRFAMDGDSALEVQTGVRSLVAADGHVDLGRQLYEVRHAELQADSVRFWPSGTSAELLALDSLALAADSIAYDGERSHLSLPSLALHTPHSDLRGGVDMDFRGLAAGQGGGLDIRLDTRWSRGDLLRLLRPWLPADFLEDFFRHYPDRPLDVCLNASGNIDRLSLSSISATLPGSFHLDAAGDITSLLDSAAQGGRLNYDVQTKDLRWVAAWLDVPGLRLPPMTLQGSATASGTLYDVDAQLREGSGTLNLQGSVDTRGALSYDTRLRGSNVNLNHFLPADSLGTVSFSATARGSGTDFLTPATRLDAQAQLARFHYRNIDLSGLQLEARVAGGRGRARLHSDTELLAATAEVDALLARQLTELTFGLDLSHADLHALGLTEEPLRTSMCMHLDGSTNLSDRHSLRGTVADIILQPGDTLFRPEDIELEAELTPDTTHLYLTSGDLLLTANGRTGYNRLLEQLSHFTDEFSRQMKERRVDTGELASRLPQIDLHLRSGEHNPVHDILKSMGCGFERAHLDLNLDPTVGINGGGHIYSLAPGAIQLDTIGWHMYQDSTGVKMDARVRNSKRNPQITFDARMNAYLLPTGAGATLTYFDERGRKGVDLGLLATIEEEGFRLHMDPLDPILAYRTFHLNDSNYVMLGRGNRVSANLDLLADDGTGLKLYSSPNEDALQDLSLALNRFNLGELMTVLPYAPRLTGYLHGDAHLIQTAENLSVSTDLTVNDMTFEGAPLGQIGLQAVYLPEADGSHFVDGTLMQTGVPVATFSGTYTPRESDGLLDVAATLERLPFSMLNGFFPDALARLEGVAIGDVHVGGTTDKPVVDGQMSTSGLRLLSDPYSLNLRFADDTIRVERSNLKFDHMKVFTAGSNPFTFDGGIDFADLSRIGVNANLTANNFELINAKKTKNSVVYGKVFVDFSAMLRGTLDNLRMFGRLNVLGATDLTYVLSDSPLTVEDELADLVEFVDFGDSTRVLNEERSQPMNINMTMSVSINDAAQIHCLLSPDATSYVDLEGGGDLTMTYSPEKNLQLNGRYTINSGTLKYTMMVIPLKEFTIKNGSYVEFRGPLMNPTLNLSATERLRTTITENDHPRSVNFDVGMNITQTLENLGLEFTLDAPDDLSIQTELMTMSAEQRGRVAVTMLATGMYFNENGSNGLTGQNALNAFLQSQISNITGKALKSVDLSIGVEQGTSATGSTQTDYSFRFAKRFWGNRVSVIVGGRVSSGANVENTGETLIDNLSVEYRLDKSATRYVKLFYDKNNESLLDGEVIEMGGGLVLRRKTNKLGELFLFRNPK